MKTPRDTPGQRATQIYLKIRAKHSGMCRDSAAWAIVESFADAEDADLAEMVRTLRDLVATEMDAVAAVRS